MPEFYTRKGDDGTTGLLGSRRVPKDHPVLEAVGTLDEASAALGLARSNCHSEQSAEVLLTVQRDLYHMMSEVAATPENAARFRQIDAARVAWLEAMVAQISRQIEMPREFIIPGDTRAGGALALARTIVRRAERCLAHLRFTDGLENPDLLPYLNRLSSLCFVLEIYENRVGGKESSNLAKA